MMKLVLFLVLLIITLPLISESFSYYDADMINYNLENQNYDFQESPTFNWKSRFPLKTQIILRGFRQFPRLLVPRGPDAPDLVKLIESHAFVGVSGALGPMCHKKSFSLESSEM